MKKTLLFLILFSQPLMAAEVCKTIDTAAWTQEQKNERQAVAYQLAFETGQNVVPNIKGDDICFESPAFSMDTTIDEQKLLDRMAANKALRDSAAIQQKAVLDEIKTIETQFESDDANFNSLTTAQKLVVMKKILRREVLKNKS